MQRLQQKQKKIIFGLLIGLVAGAFLLLGRPPTISWAQGCDPANGVWAGCPIAIAGTGVARNFLCPDGSIDDNSEQIRGEYNNRNPGYRNWNIPTELIFTNDDIINHPSMVQAVLQSHLDNGLFPSIRTWDEVGASNEKIQQVASSLNSIIGGLNNLPRSPIVFFGNEPNNWGWDVNDFARQLNAFLDAAGGTYRVFATPMDLYQNPQGYWNQVLNIFPDIMSKFDGAAISLYADTAAQAIQLYQQQVDFFHNLGIEIFMLSELGYHGGAQTDPVAFSNFIRAIFPHLADFEGLELAIVKYWDGQTHLAVILPDGTVLILDFLCLGGPPYGVPGCVDILPGATTCCPVTNETDPGLWDILKKIADIIGGTVCDIVTRIFNLGGFSFSIVSTGNLKLTKQVEMDTNYHYGNFEEYPDERRIALVNEEAEDGFWPGAYFRLAPPGYADWSEEERDEKLKWEVNLREYETAENFEGDTPDFAPYNTASSNIHSFLVKIPAPPPAGIGSSTSRSFFGMSEIPPTPSTNASDSTKTSANNPNRSNSSQTLGVQLANAESCLGLTPSAAYENGQINFGINICALGGTYDVRVDVLVNGAKYPGGFGPTKLFKGNCVYAGTPTYWAPISTSTPGVYNITFTFSVFGACPQPEPLNCTVTINQDGTSESTCGTPPPPPPGEAETCNPPYGAPPKPLCTEPYDQEPSVSVCDAVKIVVGQLEVKGYPIFPWAKYISYHLGGLETGVSSNPNEGGVYEAFLPPGEEPPLAADAPGELPLALKISLNYCFVAKTEPVKCPEGEPEDPSCCNDKPGSLGCPLGNGFCECPKETTIGCDLGISYSKSFPIKSDNNLLVSFMGHPPLFLDLVQAHLRPPVWGL